MRTRVVYHQDTDTTLWGGAALILVLLYADWALQAAVGILFPAVGWTLLYFIKREVTYRWPPKVPKSGEDNLVEDKRNYNKELK